MTTGVLQAIPTICMRRRRWTAPAPRLRTITLPLVLYSIAPIIITQYTFNFNNFNIIYLFNNGGPAVAGRTRGHRYPGVVDLQADDVLFAVCDCGDHHHFAVDFCRRPGVVAVPCHQIL
jgi:hypothetical protein